MVNKLQFGGWVGGFNLEFPWQQKSSTVDYNMLNTEAAIGVPQYVDVNGRFNALGFNNYYQNLHTRPLQQVKYTDEERAFLNTGTNAPSGGWQDAVWDMEEEDMSYVNKIDRQGMSIKELLKSGTPTKKLERYNHRVIQRDKRLKTLLDKYNAKNGAVNSASTLFTVANFANQIGWTMQDRADATKVDLVVNNIPGFGLINSAFGKKTMDFSINEDVQSQIGGSYSGTSDLFNKASNNERVGLAGRISGAVRRLNKAKRKASQQQVTMEGIAKEAEELQFAAQSDLNAQAYNTQTFGGFDPRYGAIRNAKGGKLESKINFIKSKQLNRVINTVTLEIEDVEVDTWEPIIEFKSGGKIIDDWEPVIVLHLDGGKTSKKIRTIEELIEYAKKENPRFIQRLSEEPKGIEFTDDNGNIGVGNVFLEWSTDDNGNAIIYPRIQEMEDKNLKFLSGNEAYRRAIKNNNFLIMTPEEANIFFAPDDEYGTAYKQGWPDMFKKTNWKQGSKTDKKFDENKYPLVTIKEEPWADNFFKQHPEVSGMAIGGGLNGVEGSRRVILNPYSKNINKESVIKNERLRHWMEETNFQLPEISRELFEKYIGTPYENDILNIGRTEAARYLSGDFNLLTPIQKEYILGFKQGGKTKQELETPEIEETTLKNVIPEGALHKNKHHIEHTEGLTQKGIPVIDNEGNLQAEVEVNELILTLEVTKAIEELYEKYYDEDSKQSEKDLAAIEAGKILVELILRNTDDRTGLINSIEV